MNGCFSPETATAIGCLGPMGELVAGCFFENFNGASMTAHLAIKGRITREFLWHLADYAFRQHKIKKLIAPVARSNFRMTGLALKMGFVREASIADAHPDGYIDLFTMTPAQCRFLEEKYSGKTQAPVLA